MTVNPNSLDQDRLRESVQMSIGYLVRQQHPNGAFGYEYNWKEKSYSNLDNPVRQAGTLWGLALAHRHYRQTDVLAVCQRGIRFFERHSASTPTGGCFVTYPGTSHGSMGTVALLALTLIELLQCPTNLDAAAESSWRRMLDGCLKFLLDGQNDHGLWHSSYSHDDGTAYGEPSAFYDGEAMLALVKAAKYLDYAELRERIMRAAAAGYRHNVLLALNRGGEKAKRVRGYYQWGMMSFCELIDTAWRDVDQYVEPVFYLGDMRTHGRASRNNAGAVLEGMIHAYAVAAVRDAARAASYRQIIVRDLLAMLTLQVCNPAADAFLSEAACDAAAAGGFQHYPDQPTLRIDFTQHALHAMMLGLNHAELMD